MASEFFQDSEDALGFTAGQVIFKEGQRANVMYGVVSGAVDIYFHDELLETIEAGGLFGEMALIDEKPRIGTAIAKTDCRLVGVNRERFTTMVRQLPHFSLFVMRVMAERLRRETETGHR